PVRTGQPGRHPPAAHQMGCRGGAAVRDAAVRGAVGAAGAARAGPRNRGGGRVAGGEQPDDLHPGGVAGVAAGAVVRGRAGVLPRHRRIRFGGADRWRGPGRDRGRLAVDPHPDRERRPHRRGGGVHCAAGDLIPGVAGAAGHRLARGQTGGADGVTSGSNGSGLAPARPARYLLRFVALSYVVVLVAVPVGLILWRTFAPGLGEFIASVTTPASISGLQLSLLVGAIVVPLNVVFAVPTALVLARYRCRGKAALQAVIDLPFAVSPIIVGVALILLWGTAGFLGFVENSLGLKIIFGFPGIVLASIFVTMPFVIREVEPVLHEIGTDQEEAAATLGATWWQTFWRVTLPSIR